MVAFEAMLRGDVWDVVCDVQGAVSSPVFLLSQREVEMGMYDVHMFMSLFGFGIGIMFASFHVERG